MTTINICKSIDCPYYKVSGSSGCTFYTFADHCHLLPGPTLLANEYFIYAPEMDTNELKAKNDAYFVDCERYQRHVYVQQNIEGMKEAMEFPNRIIQQPRENYQYTIGNSRYIETNGGTLIEEIIQDDEWIEAFEGERMGKFKLDWVWLIGGLAVGLALGNEIGNALFS